MNENNTDPAASVCEPTGGTPPTPAQPAAPVQAAPPETQPAEARQTGRWATAKLILGIISMVLFVIVAFQSCAAGIGNILAENGESSGSFGFIVAFNLLVTGIIAVAARSSGKKLPWIICAALLWLNYFFAKIFGGSYGDLVVWGFISFALGVFYLISSVRTKKGYIIVSVISAVYLAIALI